MPSNSISREKVITSRGEDIVHFDFHSDKLLELLGESCTPNNIIDTTFPGCNNVEFIDTVDIGLSAYPGCTFRVVFKYYDCTFGTTDVTMGDFQILDHDCLSFKSDLANAFISGATVFRDLVESINLSIFDEIQAYIIQKYFSIIAFPCQQNQYLNIAFIKATCYYLCYIEEPGSHDIASSATFVKIACGADCCERHTSICMLPNGSLDIDTYYAPSYPPTCQDPPVFSGNPILSRCSWTSSCRYRCP